MDEVESRDGSPNEYWNMDKRAVSSVIVGVAAIFVFNEIGTESLAWISTFFSTSAGTVGRDWTNLEVLTALSLFVICEVIRRVGRAPGRNWTCCFRNTFEWCVGVTSIVLRCRHPYCRTSLILVHIEINYLIEAKSIWSLSDCPISLFHWCRLSSP